jgi:hypothetical protein
MPAVASYRIELGQYSAETGRCRICQSLDDENRDGRRIVNRGTRKSISNPPGDPPIIPAGRIPAEL